MSRENGGPPGRWLRQRREDAGLSQEQLADRSGLSVRTVSSLERGSTLAPHPRTVHLLGEALGLPGKDCDELIAVYRATSRGRPVPALPEVAPTAAFVAVVPRELPGLVRHFVGRDRELAALTGFVGQAVAREPGTVVIPVIAGMAGVGKTALALQWAHQMAERFPDGQLYVNLRGYDPGRPMTAGEALAGFLRALGVPWREIPAETEPRAARYRSVLSGRRVLIVLDNAGTAEQVRPLLPATSTCVALVTSRNTLAGLVAREGAWRLDLDLLPMADAVGLLRALIGDRVDADPGAAAALAGRCSRLPLALRVAAEIAALRPGRAVADLAGELEGRQRLDLLEAGGDRGTGVRAVLSWSYQRLDASAARAFRLAGLHPGADFDRCAAAALLGIAVEKAGPLLGVLARGHLIQPTSPDRYAMHDLLRGYARELAETWDGEQERRQALTRLFDHYLHAAAAIGAGLPAEHAAAVAWLDAERANLLAVAGYMADNGWPAQVGRLADTLMWHLDAGGHYPEAVALHTHGRWAARRAADRAAEARALSALGRVSIRQGRYQDGAGHFQQALELSRQAADTGGEANALSGLGVVDRHQGRYEQAATRLQRALDLSREVDDAETMVRQLEHLGTVALWRGRYQQAAEHLWEAVDLARRTGHRDATASMLTELGVVASRQGHQRRAAALHRQALAVFRRTGNRVGEIRALNGMGEIFLATARPGDARAEFAAVLGLASRIGLRYQQARAYRGLAHACDALGDLGQADRHWQEALTMFTDLGAPVGGVRAHLVAQRPDRNSSGESAGESAWPGASTRR
ncbi:MAG TPA: tetratricopeptide repeat protein [Streptosporangiaceae bacterium]|nr:tetratricopeptide repeat protein [Streptosporangiaceae bacterium]